MANTMNVMVVSPEQVLFEGEGEMVVCRTTEGQIAFLPGHTPLLAALGTAKVRVIQPDGEFTVAVHEGFVEVTGDRVVILSDVAELPDQIDVERARSAKQRAESELSSDPENEASKSALARADLRLEVAEGVSG
ncbi:MAG: ATP synthase F1 subunit epsilon [Actinobacteria bacterium]|nr:ATP synthase F1 subunit epsilon [Actinomycetota bacterium]